MKLGRKLALRPVRLSSYGLAGVQLARAFVCRHGVAAVGHDRGGGSVQEPAHGEGGNTAELQDGEEDADGLDGCQQAEIPSAAL